MGDFEQRIPAQGLRNVTIHIQSGDIQLERIDGDEIVVEAEETVSVLQQEDTLEIRTDHGWPGHERAGRHVKHEGDRGARVQPGDFGPGMADIGTYINDVVSNAFSGIFRGGFPFGGPGHGDVRVGIPAMMERPRITVSTGSGDLVYDGLTADATLRSSSGDIRVRGAGGSLEMHSGMGDLEIDGFDGPLTARTGNGDVSLTGCTAGGAAQTGNGDIDGRDLRAHWDLQSGSGDVEIEIADEDEASLHIQTGSGDVEVRGGTLTRLEIRSGSGDAECESLLLGKRHQITTGHGDIHLAVADPPGARLQIVTRAGSVNSAYPLVMVGKQGPQSHGGARYVGSIGNSTIDVELRTASGGIEITRLDAGKAARRATERDLARTADRAATAERPATWRDEMSEQPIPEPPMPPELAEPVEAAFVPAPPAPNGEPAASKAPDQPAGENARLKVLESLQRGEITVQEAAVLLQALSGASA